MVQRILQCILPAATTSHCWSLNQGLFTANEHIVQAQLYPGPCSDSLLKVVEWKYPLSSKKLKTQEGGRGLPSIDILNLKKHMDKDKGKCLLGNAT